MSNKSMQEHALAALKKKRKAVKFNILWEEVATQIGLEENEAKKKMVKFYNALSLDARFYQLNGNEWDLAQRHSIEKIRNDKKKFDDIIDDDEDMSYLDEDLLDLEVEDKTDTEEEEE
ncbi:MAG: DNA-directed RNA polymerase subunit delta [Erysipelothrix sp.]|nr:DNA-directed RNA polymerase subunit delta [Erysipelothrix sp.]